jgi:hypothetical protein
MPNQQMGRKHLGRKIMKSTLSQFQNIGVIQAELSNDELAPIWEEVNKIKESFSLAETYNHKLVGNLEKEYKLRECKNYIAQMLAPIIVKYEENVNMEFFSTLSHDSAIMLDSAWVNFQKKHEFNPVHNHTGVYSFVIWLDIPYDTKDEQQSDPARHSNEPCAGNFSFLYTNSLGHITPFNIPCSKELNGTLLLFPAKMMHCVYPFYTSDDYRITVSGNFSQTIITNREKD